MTRVVGLGLLLALASACPRAAGDTSSDPPDPTANAGTGVESDGESPRSGDAATTACGTPGLRVEDLRWLPGSTRALVVVELESDALGPALGRLAAHARSKGHGLPIDLALPLGEWTWQIPALAATLSRAGLEPGNVAFVRTDEASGAFALQHDCDVDELRARMAEAWGLSWRSLVEGAIGRAGAGASTAAPRFPWDVLLLPGGRVMLVASGRGDAWLSALAPDPARTGVGAHMGEALARIDAAPIRGVIAGPSLVEPGATVAGGPWALRATADGVVLDDSLGAP
jgi:hypothetical protein